MPDANSRQDDELFEMILDGFTMEGDGQSLEEALRADPLRRQQAELQREIDESLRRLFAAQPPSCEAIVAALHQSSTVVPRSQPHRRTARLFGVVAALAASLLVAISLSSLWKNARHDAPDVAARPLVDLYQNAVATGFEPSYECREPERFAETFARRQGVPLKLLPMPEGSRMLGLVYTGGLSRDTTAMLAYVNDQPVMVFVDRAQNDRSDAAIPAGTLHVFREERDGLVFYEVTPLARPAVTSLLAPASPAAL
ncbi:MAG: hypothetical protein JNL18_09835 [Planctomycetaceae bacterium]|nr:hypothetical protein [Planctomycetaceae bacterium]